MRVGFGELGTFDSSVMLCCFVFQAEDGIRDLVRSRGLGDVYKRQRPGRGGLEDGAHRSSARCAASCCAGAGVAAAAGACLLYTSDAADERSSVDLGGRRIIKKTKQTVHRCYHHSSKRMRHKKNQQLRRVGLSYREV